MCFGLQLLYLRLFACVSIVIFFTEFAIAIQLSIPDKTFV